VEPFNTDLLTSQSRRTPSTRTARKGKGFAIPPQSIPDTKYGLARLSEAACWKPTDLTGQWFPTSGCDTDQRRGGSDVGSREGFMENSLL